jgi:hypothetical protein
MGAKKPYGRFFDQNSWLKKLGFLIVEDDVRF